MGEETTETNKSPSTKQWYSVRTVSEAEEANSGNRRTMEDIHLSIDNFGGVTGQGLFCVCDGHGGQDIVKFLEQNFADSLQEKLSELGDPLVVTKTKKRFPCFGGKKAGPSSDDLVLQQIIQTFDAVDTASSDIKTSGSTVACCLVRPGPKNTRTLFVANVGDTRAVLATSSGEVRRLTYDHTAADPDEIKRIEQAGGFILRGRILGILSVARAIGDHSMKKYVISRPHTEVVPLTDKEEFLIIACDGIWDVLSDEEAVKVVKEGLAEKKFTEAEAATKLIEAAVDRGTQDNVTALVVFL